jgi:hypothetical protein
MQEQENFWYDFNRYHDSEHNTGHDRAHAAAVADALARLLHLAHDHLCALELRSGGALLDPLSCLASHTGAIGQSLL